MLIASALGMGGNISTTDVGGSVRAGTSALLGALRSNIEETTLVVASDARLAKPGSSQEMQYGAGAVALTIGQGNVIARLRGATTQVDAFVDHFRATGEKYDYFWEERWIREEGYGKIVPLAVQSVLDKTGIRASEIQYFCMPSTFSGVSATIAKKLGIDSGAVVDNLAARCGDTGAAHGLLMFAAALEQAKPGDKILVVTFGAGCDALLFEATEALIGYKPKLSVSAAVEGGRSESHYTKLLSFQDELTLDWGMRAEGSEKIPLTQQYRARGQLANFVAGECPECGAVQFPQLPSCVNCGTFEPLNQRSLINEAAKVASYTADWLQFCPSPPLYFGLVQFDNGARVMMEMVDVDPAHLDVGTPLRMVLRIKSKDSIRHYNRYFWKAAPLVLQGD